MGKCHGEIRGLQLLRVPPKHRFPSLHSLKLLYLLLCRVEEATKEENYKEVKKKDYYQLPIPRANIRLLQNWEEMMQCYEKVLKVSITVVFMLEDQGAETAYQAGTWECLWVAAINISLLKSRSAVRPEGLSAWGACWELLYRGSPTDVLGVHCANHSRLV